MMLTSTLAAAEPLCVKCKKNVIKKTPSYQQYEKYIPVQMSVSDVSISI